MRKVNPERSRGLLLSHWVSNHRFLVSVPVVGLVATVFCWVSGTDAAYGAGYIMGYYVTVGLIVFGVKWLVKWLLRRKS